MDISMSHVLVKDEKPVEPVNHVEQPTALTEGVNSVLSNAVNESFSPYSLCVRDYLPERNRKGIWTSKVIPKGTTLGPYPSDTDGNSSDVEQSYNAKNDWMKHIKKVDLNLVAYEAGGEIFYRAITNIKKNTELAVWYSDDQQKAGSNLSTESHQDGLCDNLYVNSFVSSDPGHQQEVSQFTIHNTNGNLDEIDQDMDFGDLLSLSEQESDVVGDEQDIEQDIKQDVVQDNVLSGFECLTCKQTFTNSQELDFHTRSCNEACVVPLTCSECGREFKTLGGLKRHLKIHKKKKKHMCTICEEAFDKACDLKSHVKATHSECKNALTCSHCEQEFPTVKSLQSHKACHKAKSEKLLTCNVCGKDFKWANALKVHMVKHTKERNFMCSVCGRNFAYSSNLRIHLRTHSGDKPYQCSFCPKRFTQIAGKLAHERAHIGEKNFTCETCGKSYLDQITLKHHMRSHTGEKPYHCEYCDKRFALQHHYRSHLRTHTGERPHPCDQCDKKFISSGKLKRHLRVHTGDKPYKCTLCDKAFAQSYSLTRHSELHAKGKLALTNP